MICFTEQQKQEIVCREILVIEFKRSIVNAYKSLKEIYIVVKDALTWLVEKISKDIQTIHEKYREEPPKMKHKIVRRLDKCGFTEKEINLMVGGVYHCRNNC